MRALAWVLCLSFVQCVGQGVPKATDGDEGRESDASPSTVGVVIRAEPGKRVVTIDGEPFAEYRYGDQRVPILYPVRGPHGVAMTRAFPMELGVVGEATDHPHHRSLWFAHGAVNGHDFWHGKEMKIEHERSLPVSENARDRVIHTRNAWVARGERVCTDERWIEFGRDGDARIIDFRITILASHGALLFGDTKEGTMAFRVAAPLRTTGEVAMGTITDSEGRSGKAAWGKRSRWIDYSGTLEGRQLGVTIMDHPSNPRHPTWWHARGYGLAAANPFGAHDFEKAPKGSGDFAVADGDSVTFRYRFLLHPGDARSAEVAAAYERFAR